jgi:hypothetical protein
MDNQDKAYKIINIRKIMDIKQEVTITLVENNPHICPIAFDELLVTLQSFKNKKATGPGDINIE